MKKFLLTFFLLMLFIIPKSAWDKMDNHQRYLLVKMCLIKHVLKWDCDSGYRISESRNDIIIETFCRHPEYKI